MSEYFKQVNEFLDRETLKIVVSAMLTGMTPELEQALADIGDIRSGLVLSEAACIAAHV